MSVPEIGRLPLSRWGQCVPISGQVFLVHTCQSNVVGDESDVLDLVSDTAVGKRARQDFSRECCDGRFADQTGSAGCDPHCVIVEQCQECSDIFCALRAFEFCNKGNQFINVIGARTGYVHDDTSQHEAHLRSRTARILAWISWQWRDDLTEQIEELTALRDNFSNGIGCGCLSSTPFPYSNPDDVRVRKGSGAQRLRK